MHFVIWDSFLVLAAAYICTVLAEFLVIGRNAEGYFRSNKLARVLLFIGAMAVSIATTLWVLLSYGFADTVMYRANGYMALVAGVSSSFLSYLALYLIYKFVEDIFN
ncbi:hypothetical protein PsAD46_05112 [Pseudovibrio sp. Ad46]|uniref:hypothetical protein n=1 Tax=unclassified Pseudovibrio TaxID=2627060 RepID=UPI00070FDAB0|nr:MULTISPECIES: hypothetical protein [unclassified Pseudovibrio]KZK77283.1 hypothetical protein PsAD46_05112 [Pseudovibrio sp. Ad46]KZL25297.1 hypothetical protein PsWM33_02161 [Pseudovibrio sp. WM33]